MKGLVIKNTGSWYTVKTDDGQLIESKIKGNFRLKGIRSTNPVAVGDHVEIITNQEGTAFISAIEDRRNYIIRKSPNLSKQSHILAANVDQVVPVFACADPAPKWNMLDRYLGWPGQAPSYKIGQRLWLGMRDEFAAAHQGAGSRAGAVRDFHTRALALGSLPMGTLRRALLGA